MSGHKNNDQLGPQVSNAIQSLNQSRNPQSQHPKPNPNPNNQSN